MIHGHAHRALLCAALLLGACASEQSEPLAIAAGSTAPQKGRLALEADRLLEADKAFAAKVLDAGAPAAFHDFFDDTGVRLTADGEPPSGPDAIAHSLESGNLLLSWDPRFAEVFAPGDWGMTWGDWQAYERGAGGRLLGEGRYVNVWKKRRDGTWKVHMNLLPSQSGAALPR